MRNFARKIFVAYRFCGTCGKPVNVKKWVYWRNFVFFTSEKPFPYFLFLSRWPSSLLKVLRFLLSTERKRFSEIVWLTSEEVLLLSIGRSFIIVDFTGGARNRLFAGVATTAGQTKRVHWLVWLGIKKCFLPKAGKFRTDWSRPHSGPTPKGSVDFFVRSFSWLLKNKKAGTSPD